MNIAHRLLYMYFYSSMVKTLPYKKLKKLFKLIPPIKGYSDQSIIQDGCPFGWFNTI